MTGYKAFIRFLVLMMLLCAVTDWEYFLEHSFFSERSTNTYMYVCIVYMYIYIYIYISYVYIYIDICIYIYIICIYIYIYIYKHKHMTLFVMDAMDMQKHKRVGKLKWIYMNPTFAIDLVWLTLFNTTKISDDSIRYSDKLGKTWLVFRDNLVFPFQFISLWLPIWSRIQFLIILI